jgi:GT2 family glycosyltransferase
MIAENVTATVSTKGRFNTTLPLVLTSLANQTVKPSTLFIYDDNPTLEDLRNNDIYKNLFTLLNRVGINWEVKVGGRVGQVINHNRALEEVKTDWIWRLDDDNIMEANTLQRLSEFAFNNSNIGAVGPLILDPKNTFAYSALGSNKIEDIFIGLNIQWMEKHSQKIIDVDHLQGSTFLFRKEAGKHGYDSRLSKVGHREETIFTHEMKRAGWRLSVLTDVKTWHMRYGAGGIRSQNEAKFFEQDEKVFYEYLKKWKVPIAKIKVIPLDGGIGDHYAFRSTALPAIKKKYFDHRIIIGACYPEIFEEDVGIEIVSLAESCMLVNKDENNIYAWMDKHNWSKTLGEAYKTKYTS